MTPGARVAAAIEILDTIEAGLAAEQALTRWARQSRYAGSKDRAAVRDHVFDVLRRKRSASVYGGGFDGRALMIGALREGGADLEVLFTGEGHAPDVLSDTEARADHPELTQADRWNLPDWLIPDFTDSLGTDADKAALVLQARAPVTLRVNIQKSNRDAAIAALRQHEIEAVPNPLSETALTVMDGARRVRNAAPFLEGMVELQDAASQAVVDALPSGARCLDYCAGGGGKALAMAAIGRTVFAHDVEPARMRDLPNRGLRAGAEITPLAPSELRQHAPYDLVLCDAPCSGSGAWRRSPHGKWTLTQARLDALNRTQDAILAQACELVSGAGTLVYATCSVLKRENEDRLADFLSRNAEWHCTFQKRIAVTKHGDGFFTAHLTRVKH